jgi:hypothetical protein
MNSIGEVTMMLTSNGNLSGSMSHLITDFVREKPAVTAIMKMPTNNLIRLFRYSEMSETRTPPGESISPLTAFWN